MAEMEARGEQLMRQADAKLKSGGGLFGRLGFGGGGKESAEEAAGMYSQAGNMFKASKKWSEAAKAYKASADANVKAGNDHEASTAFIECARCFIKDKDFTNGAMILQDFALPRVIYAGKLTQAAKLHDEAAQMFDGEGDFERAIEHYGKAADYFEAENAKSTALKAKSRIATLCMQLPTPDPERAQTTFEEVAAASLESQLLKFSAKGHLFNAFLCILVRADVVAAKNALAKYFDLDYTMGGSREGKLCEDVLKAYEDLNAEAFTDAVYNYDQISQLDPWRTNILLKVKQQIAGAGGGAGGGGEGGGGGVDLT